VRILAAIYGCFLLLNLGFAQQQSHQCTQPAEEGIFISEPPVSAPQPIYTPQPEYPSLLRNGKPRIQGTCLLGVKVDEQGRVSEVHVTRSLDQRLDQNATDAVKRWKFKPAMRDGKPVTACISVEVDFRRD
jgi:protein TonB